MRPERFARRALVASRWRLTRRVRRLRARTSASSTRLSLACWALTSACTAFRRRCAVASPLDDARIARGLRGDGRAQRLGAALLGLDAAVEVGVRGSRGGEDRGRGRAQRQGAEEEESAKRDGRHQWRPSVLRAAACHPRPDGEPATLPAVICNRRRTPAPASNRARGSVAGVCASTGSDTEWTHTPPDGDVWVGIDLGTQIGEGDGGVRRRRGAGVGTSALHSERDGKRHEQDPAAWWEAVAAASREALRGVAPERVGGVATCATSGTILLVDRDGEPLTPALMYDDGRAVEQAARVDEAGFVPARVAPSWALPKLLWMLDERPELAREGRGARGARLAHQADVVTRRLVGKGVPSDSSHALKTGYDQVREAWPLDALERLACRARCCPRSCARARGSARSARGPPRRPGCRRARPSSPG